MTSKDTPPISLFIETWWPSHLMTLTALFIEIWWPSQFFLVLLCRNSWTFRESVQGIKEKKYLHYRIYMKRVIDMYIHTKTVLSFVVSCPHTVSFPLEAVRKKLRSVASQCCITDSEFIKNIQTRSHHIRNALIFITSLDVFCTPFMSVAW
jgi:hypothetical protein